MVNIILIRGENMVLGTIGTLLAAGAIARTAERRSMNAYPTLNKEGYDKHNALHGINIYDINKIAARNGVRCDKYGVLPENGWTQCVRYVRQYANTLKDMEEFPKVWVKHVEKQLEQKHETIKQEATEYYNQYKHVWMDLVNQKTSQTDVLQLKHWRGMAREEHQKRLDEMMQTDWRMIVANGPILRPLPNSTTSHLEVWEVYESPKIRKYTPYTMYYKWFCKLCGYDPQL